MVLWSDRRCQIDDDVQVPVHTGTGTCMYSTGGTPSIPLHLVLSLKSGGGVPLHYMAVLKYGILPVDRAWPGTKLNAELRTKFC